MKSNMPEKKTTTKKTVKKPEEKPAIVEVAEIKVEIKAPVYVAPQDPLEKIEDDNISEEIAKAIKETAGKPDRYFEAIGRRKTAVARVRLYTKGDKEFIVNDQPYIKYFQTTEDQESAVCSM